MIAFASSLDQAGAFATSAEDAARLLEAMSGFDARDSTSIDRPVESYAEALGNDLNGLKIGLPKEFFSDGLDADVGAAVEAAIDELKKLGAEIK